MAAQRTKPAPTPGRLAMVVVWDGLRPDFVTPDVTPTLHRLATGGVWCERSHCAYPSETRVNASAIATGSYPGRTGITANSIYVPGFDSADPAAIANTGDHRHLARIAEIDPPLLGIPTTADQVLADGGAAFVASSGSPGSAFLQAGDPTHGAAILNHALLRPDSLRDAVIERFGSPPPNSIPATALSDWVTRGLLELLLPERVAPAVRGGDPAIVHWWLTDPDHTAHAVGLGAPETIQSLRENDRRLAALMDTLAALELIDHTDVILTSDHGFSTAGPRRWSGSALAALGVPDLPADVEVVTTGQGGALSIGPSAARHAAAIVRHLQSLEWVGAIFTRDGGPAAGLPGTLPLSALWNGRVGRRAPDVRFSFAWSDAPNQFGVAGSVLAGSGRGASHGSASPHDMRNSLFAWGPRFRRALRSDTPVGAVDVAPTVRLLLGLPQTECDGRVLEELLDVDAPAPHATTRTLDAALPDGSYRQSLTLARVGATDYVVQATAWRQ
ncbi:MAG TPA: alkaline phosphatase family protein [Chloroflexota bacterium]|nr:alkaline phosphatase family protein [Chloroflexota bacterium]